MKYSFIATVTFAAGLAVSASAGEFDTDTAGLLSQVRAADTAKAVAQVPFEYEAFSTDYRILQELLNTVPLPGGCKVARNQINTSGEGLPWQSITIAVEQGQNRVELFFWRKHLHLSTKVKDGVTLNYYNAWYKEHGFDTDYIEVEQVPGGPITYLRMASIKHPDHNFLHGQTVAEVICK